MTDPSKDDPAFKDEIKMLGGGVMRTAYRDAIAVALGAIAGGLLCAAAAWLIGWSVLPMAKLGAIVGMFIALVGRSMFSKLFDYKQK